MIRLLLICLILISCDTKVYEVKYKDLSDSTIKDSLDKFELLKFNPQIEMMIIFLWPLDLGAKDEKEVVQIISTSRKISEDKELYLKNLYNLKMEYLEKNCDCHTLGLCDDGQDMDDDIMLECEEISERQNENNQIFANLTLDHENIKTKLKSIGAVNIDIGLDENYLDIGTYDLFSKVLNLNKFEYLGRDQKLEFKVIPYKDESLKAKFIFNIDNEVFTGDLGVSNKQYNVIFSGEIKTNNGQRGLIYWEHLK